MQALNFLCAGHCVECYCEHLMTGWPMFTTPLCRSDWFDIQIALQLTLVNTLMFYVVVQSLQFISIISMCRIRLLIICFLLSHVLMLNGKQPGSANWQLRLTRDAYFAVTTHGDNNILISCPA